MPAIGSIARRSRLRETAEIPVFSDLHVRHYDLQFAYASTDEDEVIYRRITVQPALVVNTSVPYANFWLTVYSNESVEERSKNRNCRRSCRI
jgi:hypothetical protein